MGWDSCAAAAAYCAPCARRDCPDLIQVSPEGGPSGSDLNKKT
jgi:hypothetical protein